MSEFVAFGVYCPRCHKCFIEEKYDKDLLEKIQKNLIGCRCRYCNIIFHPITTIELTEIAMSKIIEKRIDGIDDRIRLIIRKII